MGPLFDGESVGPRPGLVEIRCSITVKTWLRLIGSRPASASARHRLATRKLVQYEAVDLQQVSVVTKLRDDMVVPHLVEECARGRVAHAYFFSSSLYFAASSTFCRSANIISFDSIPAIDPVSCRCFSTCCIASSEACSAAFA